MNIDQLEDDLRAALAARADEVPTGAATRVRAHHYRPRTRGLRPPVAVGGVTVAAATGAAVWLFALSPQTSSAFAGWTATPTTAAPGQVSTAESTCENRVADIPTGRRGDGASGPASAAAHSDGLGADLAGLQPVLTDTRGPFTWVILASSDARTLRLVHLRAVADRRVRGRRRAPRAWLSAAGPAATGRITVLVVADAHAQR